MNTPRTLRSRPATCVHCGQALTALRASLRQVCERPDCMQYETLEQRRAERAAHDADIRRALEARLPPERAQAMPIVWMRTHEVDLVPLPQPMREQQTQHLLELLETAAGAAAAEPERAGTTPTRAEVQICTWCSGRCCRFGKDNHAFITAAHLRRWQLAHPEGSLADAAQAYIDALPEQHVQESCYYHGAQGCTLPREMRSSICNRHVCNALDEVQVHCQGDAERELVLVMGRRDIDGVRLAAVEGLLPLEPPPV
jgi:hypothetical protein